MERQPSPSTDLDRVGELKKNYDWILAADLYEKVAGEAEVKGAFSEAAELCEKAAYSLLRAAYQADSRGQFEDRMKFSEEAWERASNLHSKTDSPLKTGQVNHCRAQSLYAREKRLSDPDARRKILDECRALEKSAAQEFEANQYTLKMGEACIGFLNCLVDRLEIEWDGAWREKLIGEALDYGERAIRIPSGTSDIRNFVQAYYLTAFFYKHGYAVRSYDALRIKECADNSLAYAEKALEVAKGLDDVLLLGRANFQRADSYLDVSTGPHKAAEKYLIAALDAGRKCKDNLLTGDALYVLVFVRRWDIQVEEDPDKILKLIDIVDEFALESVQRHSVVSYDAGTSWAYAFKLFGRDLEERIAYLETDPEARRRFLLKRLDEAKKGLEYSRRSGCFESTWWNNRNVSSIQLLLAKFESDPRKRQALLGGLAKSDRETVGILETASGAAKLGPIQHNLGVVLKTLGETLGELSGTEVDLQRRISLLEEAAQYSKRGLDEIEKSHAAEPEFPKAAHAAHGRDYIGHAKNLLDLYSLKRDIVNLDGAVDVVRAAIDHYTKADTLTFRAEGLWLLSKTLDLIGKHDEAARSFEHASQSYEAASKAIPSLSILFSDLASYMRAWSQVESARQNHSLEEYGSARENYQKAAQILYSTKAWNYLVPNFSAWSTLEGAEGYSRAEKFEEAIDAFKRSTELFSEAKAAIEAHGRGIQSEEEKRMAEELITASLTRKEYCFARVGLEEGRLLQRKGRNVDAAEKFRSASEAFSKILRSLKSEYERKELEPIVLLCQALYHMALAESKGSTDLYARAAEYFEKMKELTTVERMDLLADAGMQFCKALGAAMWFKLNRNPDMFSKAKVHLQNAAESYTKAGFENAANWATATERLLDAYVYMDNASKETDPEKKAKYYALSEKLLQLAADAYDTAGYEGKKNEVLGSLQRVRQQREIAITLSDILKAPPSISTTAAFSLPTPTYETPVGLERFEHADVQGNLSADVREVGVGDKLGVELELVNAGKAPAVLMKVEGIIPEGFELAEKPEAYRLQGKSLELKGRRLEPLKTEGLKLALKALSKGVFTMKPRILYLDDTGKYRVHELEPITVTVNELGISGWIRGPVK